MTSVACAPTTLQPISPPSSIWRTTFCAPPQAGTPCACAARSPPGTTTSSQTSSDGRIHPIALAMYVGDHACLRPNHPALIDAGTGATQTYAELDARSNRLAHLLR